MNDQKKPLKIPSRALVKQSKAKNKKEVKKRLKN